MKRFLQLVLLVVLPSALRAQNVAPTWEDWQFLLGEWTATQSSGVPGPPSKGSFTLAPDLGGQALVRKNHAEYPPAGGRPAIVHDDLMIIYHVPTGPGKFATRAFYDDSEGHVINYDVNFSPDKKRIVFLSEASDGAPQYRLTYENVQPGTAKVMFEIAPPDKPGEFATYVQAMVRRK
ncbi:MAG TPA: hypothetical protein VIX19_07325 [Terriglobales bacterium]